MKWEQQTKDACLAYALWSIGGITKEERDEYAQYVAPYLRSAEEQVQWVRDMAPWAEPLITGAINTGGKPADVVAASSPVIPANGTGVLSLRQYATRPGDTNGNHAMAYASGKVLDPDGPGRLETWEEYTERMMRDYGRRVVLLAVAPKKRSRKA